MGRGKERREGEEERWKERKEDKKKKKVRGRFEYLYLGGIERNWNESRENLWTDERIGFYRKRREKSIKEVEKMETIKSEEKIDSRGETLVEGRETNEGWRGER